MKETLDKDIPKYQKKKNSSVSKSKEKSKHKHEYVECLFVCGDTPCRGTYCKICGKIGEVHRFETERCEGSNAYRALQADEVYKKFSHLEKIEIEDIFQKYAVISKE